MIKISFMLTLALSLSLYSAAQQAVEISKIELPDMGDSSGTLITPEEEKEFGEAFFRSLHSQIRINEDAEIQQYIESIGQKLVANSDAPSNPFHFFVVMENDINAFAGPGGYIGVNSGLILITEEESELASVIGHEIAHVTQRHLYRAAEASSRLSIPTMAATLAAILLGTQSPALGQAAIMAIQAGSVQFQINFTRENEEEADRVGMQTLAASHFDPRSMPTFFERLQQSTRYYGQNIPEFLRTHPVTTSRISDTRGRAETYPYKQYPDTLAYLLTKTKVRVLTGTEDADTLKYFQTRLNQGTTEQRIVAKYGLALLALKEQKFTEAETIFQALKRDYPNQPQYAAGLARTAMNAQNYPTALARYKKLTEQFPDNEAIALEYITALLKAGSPKQAQKNLASLSSKTQKLPVYSELMAQTYSDLKQPAESHRYLAEYYYATGSTQDAVMQIKLAQRSKGVNFRLAAILNERLRFFLNEEQVRRNR
ncbi:MAG: M48 family metallopeptidase [Methylococcaceae bacterium]|nr:M48 family metallopeptidase [Methylococcaceae bacterium]